MVDTSRAKEVAEEYLSSLADLTINSKPLITMLTILAEENIEFASNIVDIIERHIAAVSPDIKLPILYLIDSIVKNVGQQYKSLFNVKIANIFCDVFSKVNEKIREKMYALRQTWNDVFPQNKLYTLDVKVNHIDRGWPITAKPNVPMNKSPAIHVNPNFLKNKDPQALTEQLQRKQMELLELQKKKQELQQGLNKKTASLRNQQNQQPSRAHPPGHTPVPVNSLPRIPKKVQDNNETPRDPRLARQNREPKSTTTTSPGQTDKSPATSPNKTKQSSGKRSSGSDGRSSSTKSRDRGKDRTSTGSSSSSNSSGNKNGVTSDTSPTKRSDRSESKKRPRSPSVRSHKRSREKSPAPNNENNKSSTGRSKGGLGSGPEGQWTSKRDRKATVSNDYQDRNPSPQITGDVDLRVELRTKDLDLRTMPIEKMDISESKVSNEDFMDLFGTKDLDLRQLAKVPPAPIISKPDPAPVKATNSMESARAKLNELTKKDKLGRTLLYNQLPSDPNERKRRISNRVSDVDLRQTQIIRDDTNEEDLNQSINIIITQAQEQLASNKINQQQFTETVKQVLLMHEAQKVRQAQLQENLGGTPGQRNPSPLLAPTLSGGNSTPPQFPTVPVTVPNLMPGTEPINPWQTSVVVSSQPEPIAAQPSLLLPPASAVVPHPPQPPLQPPIPPPILQAAIPIDPESVRTIQIDGIPREIRFYEETAVIFMSNDDPREIGFENGQRRLTVDGMEVAILNFNDTYIPISINGKVHQVRLGSPSRELYVDSLPFECFFGGSPLSILIDGVIHHFSVDGPEPKVKIGGPRLDLVQGKVQMIVDGFIVIPVYLDGRPQPFELESVRHILQLTNYLATAVIDGVAFEKIEYGGLPRKFNIGNKKRFIRFTTLPKGVVVGQPPPTLAALTAAAILPADTGNETSQPANDNAATVTTGPGGAPLNFEDLFQKLMASGIIGSLKKDEPEKEVQEKKEEAIPVVNLSKPETIKKRSGAIIESLFIGMQCSSCGVRFPPEQTMRYSQHLDWHFRQNRRERDASKKAMSRRWYYDVSDWIQYEEIEDLEEREKNWFEKGKEMEIDNDVAVNSPATPLAICPAGPKGAEETCEVCHDRFEYFFNEETEDWCLKNAIRVEEIAYHPTCYEDLQAKERRKKAEAEKMETDDNSTNQDATENGGDEEEEEYVPENKERGDDPMSDFDDDVMVLSPVKPTITEILDDDDDENGYKVNEIEDTSAPVDSPKGDATPKVVEPVDDESIDHTTVKVKEEKIDESYENVDPFEDVGTIEIDESSMHAAPEPEDLSNLSIPGSNENSNGDIMPPPSALVSPTAGVAPTPSTPNIDGNISLSEPYAPPITVNKIKVNIVKPQLSTVVPSSEQSKDNDASAASAVAEKDKTPEPEPTYELKKSLRGIEFKKLKPASIGSEASGLCSIM